MVEVSRISDVRCVSDVRRPLCRTSVMRRTSDVDWGGADRWKGARNLGKGRKNLGEPGRRKAKVTQKKVDPLGKHHIHGSKPTKSHKNQQVTRSWVWLFLVGIFELGKNTTKKWLEKRGGGTPNRGNRADDTN